MKRLTAFLFLFAAVQSYAQLQITNHTFLLNFDDSKSTAQYGQRLVFFRFSDCILLHPDWVVSCRDQSRSGGSTWEMLTNRIQSQGYPNWGAAQGKTNVIAFFTASDNGGAISNAWYTNFLELIQAPGKAYNTNALFTNDWSASTNLFQKVLFADGVAQGADAGTTIRDANLAVLNIANSYGLAYVDSWSNVAPIEVAIYATNTSYGFFGVSGHPDNAIQMLEWLTDRRSLGEDSNVFTAVLDWNSATPSQTNHCTVTGVSVAGSTLNLTFHADRMAGGYYTVDASQTNDCTPAFGLLAGASNIVCEILRITNCPAGNYNVFEDGVQIGNVPSSKIAGGLNLFTDVHNGALWNQKKECLGLLCDYAHVNRTNASDTLPFNALWTDYGSYASARWPTNAGMSNFITLMQDKEADLIAEDQIVHANAQQTNHTFSIGLIPPRYVGARR